MQKQQLRDIIYSSYKSEVNMPVSQLLKWKQNPLSDKRIINTTLRLNTTPKLNWTTRFYKSAIQAITYIKKNKKSKSQKLNDWGCSCA